MDHDGSGRFAKGNCAGAATRFEKGNTAGAATRFGAEGRSEGLDVWDRHAFSEAIARHFRKHGPDVLNHVRKTRPVDYLKLCLQLMPKGPPAGDVDISRLLDEEIARLPDGEVFLLLRKLREDGETEEGAEVEDDPPGAAPSDCG